MPGMETGAEERTETVRPSSKERPSIVGEPGEGFVDFVEGKRAAGPVLLESVDRYDESGWHSEAEPGHGNQVGALVAEKSLLFAVVGETIDVSHGKYITRLRRQA